MLPTFGFRDQVTAVFWVPVTEALKAWLCPETRLDEPGETRI
jgi:hypothetical protein